MNEQNSKAPSKMGHLFICQSWPYAVMSLAHLDSVKDIGSHDFLMLSDPDKLEGDLGSVEIRRALALFGHKQVDWFETRQVEYGEVHLSPSGLLQPDATQLKQISYQRLVATGDSHNNRVFGNNRIDSNVVQLVHYGFRLIERALLSTALPKDLAETSHVVSYDSILNTWQRLNSLMGQPGIPPRLGKGDLLFCERYWGRHQYAMFPDADAGAYLRAALRLEKKSYKRVIFRPTTRSGPENLKWEKALSDYAEEAKIEFVTWADIYGGFAIPSILNHPEAQLFLGNLSGLGGLFAFDGSLATLFGALNTETTVHWGDSVNTEDLFVGEQTPNLVIEQIMLMRSVSALYLQKLARREDDEVTMTISGSSSRLAEADSIRSSLSWKITKPLRLLAKPFLR